jgi:imidazole glycerol-phosphate synthase
MLAVIREATSRMFVSLTIGGGIKDTVDHDGTPRSTLEVAGAYFRAGADKVSIESEAFIVMEHLLARGRAKGTARVETVLCVWAPGGRGLRGPASCAVLVDPDSYDGLHARKCVYGQRATSPLSESDSSCAWRYQCIVSGRESRLLLVKQLAQGVETLGAGEILLNSIDRGGTSQGFDLVLIDLIRCSVHILVMTSSEAGVPRHFVDVFERTGVEAALAPGVSYRSGGERGKGFLSDSGGTCSSAVVAILQCLEYRRTFSAVRRLLYQIQNEIGPLEVTLSG